MTNPLTGIEAYTDEELKQALAGLISEARVELLNDTEVQRFWQLYEEIQRRRGLPNTDALVN